MTTCDSTKTPISLAQRCRDAEKVLELISASLRLCAILLLLAKPAFADWPLARGDKAGTGVAKASLSNDLQLLWKYTAEGSAFEATPVVAGGFVYIGDADGTMHAVQLADGKPVWSAPAEDTSFSAGAAVEGDRLYAGDIFGVVRCYAAADGDELWSFNTDSEVFAAPNVYEGALLVTTESGQLFSLNAGSGEERWRFTIEAPLRCSPTVIDGRTLLAGCDAKLHAVDLATGKEVGSLDIGSQTGSTAAINHRRSYFGAESGVFTAVDAEDPLAMTVAWTYRDPRRGQGIRTAAAVSNSLVAYGSNGKAIYGLHPETGDELWVKPVRSRVESSPLIVSSDGGADRVIAATTRGRLLMLNGADGETLWEYDAGGAFLSSPAVTDGRLLIANDNGTLYCFGTMKDKR